MGTISKYDQGQWKAIASSDATQITTNNSVLREYTEALDSEILNVDKTLEALAQQVKTLKGNVAWLAKHGGGGSGGSGGGNAQADGIIYVNGNIESNSTITRDNDDLLSFTVKAGDSGISYDWNYVVTFNNIVIKTGKLSTNGTVVIANSSILLDYNNGQGELSITCSSGLKSIYWNGVIIQNNLLIQANTSLDSFDFNQLDSSFINITYSSTILGQYIISINDKYSLEVTIAERGRLYTQQVKVSDIYDSTKIGSNNTVIKIQSVENPTTYSEIVIPVVIISNTIVISCTSLSGIKDKPSSVIFGSTIPIVFTTFLSNASIYDYEITIDGVKVIEGTSAVFGREISHYIPSSQYSIRTNPYEVIISASTPNQPTVSSIYYVVFTESSTLKIPTPSTSYLLTDLTAYADTSYNNTGLWTSSVNDYQYIGSTATNVTQSVQLYNNNILSGIKQSGNNPPYFRTSNKAYGVLGSYNIGGEKKTFAELVNSRNNFSIQLSFKADYHTDDNRTILVLGDYIDDPLGYKFNQGIEIKVHEITIKDSKASLSIPLQDNEITDICISYDNASNLTKVYVDGVITGSSNTINLKQVIGSNLVDSNIYIGCSKKDLEFFNYADIQIYRMLIYTKALTDYEVLLNFLQNSSYTHFTEQGLPNGDIIAEGFERNFINYNSTTGKVDQSYFWNDNLQDYSVSNFITTSVTEEGIKTGISSNVYQYTIPLPILYLDVSSSEKWSWNNFTSNNNSVITELKNNPVTNVPFNYYDPTGSNTKIIENGVCAISIQGTSTLNDIIKNLDFTLNWDSSSPTKTVFIPKENWCPEDKYTLKADIVDSSHSSNAAIGKFINDVLAPDINGWYAPHQGVYNKFNDSENSFVAKSSTEKYKPTMKVAVEGFPVFVIIRFYTPDPNIIDVHSIGIYQFILGRDSEHNLGMKALSGITDSNGSDIQVDAVPFYKTGCTISEFDMSSQWIEAGTTISMPTGTDLISLVKSGDIGNAQLTAAYWQSDSNTLDTLYEVKYGTAQSSSQVSGFQNLVENIAMAPVRISSYSTAAQNVALGINYYSGYPRYTTQDGTNWIKTGQTINQVYSQDALQDLAELLDLQGAYKYATVAMMFGLVDNFCKNMPFIQYDSSKQFRLGFYDMDTALGITNQGELGVNSYVYMKGLTNNSESLIEEYYSGASDAEAITGKDNKLFLSLESPQVMALDQGVSSTEYNSYSKYWINLRNTLYNIYKNKYNTLADFFVDEYFVPQTKGCGELLFNLTYQSKYINSGTYSKLHGRRITQVRQWLKEHIQFLDSITQWKTTDQVLSLGESENIETVAITSFDYYRNIDIKTNVPLVIKTTNQGGQYGYSTFCPKNELVPIVYGGGTTTASVSKTISYSDNLLQIGNDQETFGASGFQKINNGTLLGFNDLDLSNCSTFSSDSASPIDFENVFYDNGSELRTINLSNTTGAKNLSLDLENFTKLTDIDIYNGCVSSIILPKTPLVSLNVTNSTITELTLDQQALLKLLDVQGCNSLQKLEIINCEKLTGVNNIKNLNNLKNITIASCPEISNVVISNCSNLTNVEIKLEKATSIQITGCPKLTTLKISGSSSTLKTLNVSNCTSLGNIAFDDKIYSNLTTFNAYNTQLNTITWGTTTNSSYLDLSKFTGLINPDLRSNTKLTKVQFNNNHNSPIQLGINFNGCSNLERVYGNVKVTCSSCFKDNTKFSIHGPTVNNSFKWKGQPVLSSGRYMSPYEIINKQAKDITPQDLFQSGLEVTNMTFSRADSTFYNTNYTIFDVYYALLNIGSATNLQFMFALGRNSTYGRFNWSKDIDNSPNRYMFIKCNNVTSIDHLFYSSGSNVIRYFSPTNDGTDVITDDGLFSPLVKLTNFNFAFGSYQPVIDRFVFRRVNSQYNITTMTYFWNNFIIDDVNTASYSDYSTILSSPDKSGNLSNFFNNLTKLSNSQSYGDASGLGGFCHNTRYINFDITKNFKIPSGIQSLRNVITAQYGKGELILEDLFAEPSKVINIANSFIITNSGSSNVTWNITSDTFKKFTQLKGIGYYYDPNSGLTGSVTSGSFTGAGLTKIVAQQTFPYDLFDSCYRTLQRLDDLFLGASMQKDTVYSDSNPILLPGSLFHKCINLTTVVGTFYNFKAPIKLEAEGFKNCTKLADVDYLFGNNGSNIQGAIPARMFYHGTKTTKPIIITGSNTEPIYNKETDSWSASNVETITINYSFPNTNINSMKGCFSYNYGLEPYEYKIKDSDIEENPDYSPFKWIRNADGSWSENSAENHYQYTYRWLYDGVNKPTTTKNVDCLDDGVGTDTQVNNSTKVTFRAENTPINWRGGSSSDTMQFCCPPDLFRYCANTTGANTDKIVNCFYNCGHLNYYDSIGSTTTLYTEGLKGRIPPYLLLPISNITSISGLFYACKPLSCYSIVDDSNVTSYLIPRDFFKYAPKVSDLSYAFSGMKFPSTIDLNVFNNINTSVTLNLSRIFVSSHFNDGASIVGIFNNYNISNCAYAFSVQEATSSTGVANNRQQRVSFNNVFKNYSGSAYNTNMNYSYAFSWYLSGYVTHENPKTLTDNATTRNYIM